MILFLLKITLLLACTLAAAATMRRSSAAMRHVICVCGLAGALLLAATLVAPASSPAFRLNALSVPSAAHIAHSTTGIISRLIRLLPWLWAAGVIVLLARLSMGYRRLSALLRNATSYGPNMLLADVSVPVVAGLLRPLILLPRAAAEWPLSRMSAVLRHEREHLRRHDLWTLLLSHFTCAVYWFHPLVWMVAAQLRREQEQACDDAVILSGFEPASYAEALIAAAQNLTSTRLIGCHLMTQNTFRFRIARLLAEGMPRATASSTLRRAAIVFAGAVITIGLLNGKPQSADESGAYKVGNGVSAPAVLFKVDPSYSEEARAAKVDGNVLLSLVIGADGLAHDINVVRGIGSGLDEKAVEAVQKWRFKPGMRNGEAVRVKVQIEINFKLL